MERSIRQILGERIVLLRCRARLSQPELAQKARMSVTTLNRVENAHQSLYMEKVAARARHLGVSADYLLGLSDDDREMSWSPATSAEEQTIPTMGEAVVPVRRKGKAKG
jgi:transcriptional regulator with XRE-family HTH domain